MPIAFSVNIKNGSASRSMVFGEANKTELGEEYAPKEYERFNTV